MTRLIDADALLEELRKSCEWHAENSRELSLLQRDINIVGEQPTIDAVPVIRCKDCKHWARNDGMFKDFDGRQWHHCPHLGIDTDGYFSCIEGERKEENGK